MDHEDDFTLITRLEARLQQNTGNTLRLVFMMFTRSGITPTKVNRFGWNLEHSWVHSRGLVLADFGRDPRSSERWTATRKSFLSTKQPTISLISRRPSFTKFENNTLIGVGVAMNPFGTEFWKFFRKGSFFQKTQAKKNDFFSTSINFRAP